MKLLFGTPTGQTEESKEVCKLLKEYEKKLKDSFCTETLTFSDEELIGILKYCIDNNLKIDTVVPGINDFDGDTDL
ncbi:hypothetical protein CLPUN_46090 [Clostridium puniceum]|uniref:Uncharacterized protein n=1 Tax=Clostridium puniceum TaxID=29367 RepID=A0A1S8T557_9CLOT|nr:hypothetical protein [Clostridium puniceum]OOM72906.1 hypothetical protein CLPUN_46090 [Clostridium puniceum]